MSFFDRFSDLPYVLTTGFERFKSHLSLFDLILMLKEYIGLNFFIAFFLLLMLLLVIVFFLIFLEKIVDSCVSDFTSATSAEILKMTLQVHCFNINGSYFL